MRFKNNYLVSYNFGADGRQGSGSMVITVSFSLWGLLAGYTHKDLHNTRKIVAEGLRSEYHLEQTQRVKVVLMNIIKFPI